MSIHPYVTGLDELTIEQLQAKVSELQKKMNFVSRSGNYNLITQMQLILGDYNEAIQRKLQEQVNQNTDMAHIMDKIDIS